VSYVVAISGVSGSGKSTLARRLVEEFQATHLCLDNYYFPTDAIEFGITDFEDPTTIDAEQAAIHAATLKAGHPVESPIYDFTLCVATDFQILQPAPLIVIEGQYSALYPSIRKIADLTVLLDVDWHLCMSRRVQRDEDVLHRPRDESQRRFETGVLKMFERHQCALRENSNLVLEGENFGHWIDQIRLQIHP